MSSYSSRSSLRTLTVYIVAAFALLFFVRGIWFSSVSGTFYYLITAVLLSVVAVQLYKRASGSLWVYSALLLGSLMWVFWKFGTDFRILAPDLEALGLLGLWLLFPAITKGMGNLNASKIALATTLFIVVVAIIYSIFVTYI